MCHVHYVGDPELAYVMQRYRKCHDFYHCILGMPVNVVSELAVKFFEFSNLGLPMAGLAAATSRTPSASNSSATFSAQSLITIYWENRWEQNVEDMKRESGIWDPPVEPRWGRALSEAQAVAMRAKQQKEASS
ncbi:coenzyme Q biosynthesis protein Coq4-domain-containing protein [Fomes fomentarius]|nr:coenzyme Q biosynthesis protein Coq4-domain-containing protein [Fomes fomentarius]